MVAWGPIIGAGISALGSLFGSDDDEKETRTTIDYAEMARSAEAAGFNPLTAIRNGGSAGFVTTHHPALSSHVGIGAALGTLGNAIMSFDPRADERAALEQKLQEARLVSIEKSNARDVMRSFDTPSAAGSTISTKPGRGGAGGGAGAKPGQPVSISTQYVDQYGNVLEGPSEDTPDAELLLSPPLMRMKTAAEAWLERSYGPKAGNDPVRQWKRVESWADTFPTIPAVPNLPGIAYGGRGNVRPQSAAKKKARPLSPWGPRPFSPGRY